MTTATAPAEITPDFASRVFYAPSASHPGFSHTLRVITGPTGAVRVTCDCPAVTRRRTVAAVPCRHAKAVVALLADHGLVSEIAGAWRATGAALDAGGGAGEYWLG